MSNIQKILSLILAGAAVVGIIYGVDSRFAKAEYVQQIERRLDYKIDKDRAEALQERLWRLEDRYPKGDRPPEIRDECRKLRLELNALYGKMGIKVPENKGAPAPPDNVMVR